MDGRPEMIFWQNSCKYLTERIEEVARECSSAQTAIMDLKRNFEAREAQRAEVIQQLGKARAIIASKGEAVEELATRIKVCEFENKTAGERLDRAHHVLSEQSTAIASLNTFTIDLKTRATSFTAIVETLNEEKERAEKDLDDSKGQYLTACQHKNSLEEENGRLLAVHRDLQRKVEYLQMTITALAADLEGKTAAEMRDKVRALEDFKRSVSADAESLQQDFDRLQEVIRTSKCDNAAFGLVCWLSMGANTVCDVVKGPISLEMAQRLEANEIFHELKSFYAAQNTRSVYSGDQGGSSHTSWRGSRGTQD